jgi:hypothetical protein
MSGVDFNSMNAPGRIFPQKTVAQGYREALDTDLRLHICKRRFGQSIENPEVKD